MTCQKFTKKLTQLANLPELYKRCPPNQLNKFMEMRDKHSEYKNRVEKLPEHLPSIDWEYYRTNVRTEYVKMVDEFERKYQELNKVFDSRHDLVDTSGYYTEVEQLAKDVKTEVDNFIVDSNKRIKSYEDEIARIQALIPYEQMTAQDFCEMCPDKAEFFPCDGKPLFWPHTPEEQTPGPAGVLMTPEQKAYEDEMAARQLVEEDETGIPLTEPEQAKAATASTSTPADVAPKKADPAESVKPEVATTEKTNKDPEKK